MSELGMTGALARRCATHPWITIAVWAVLLAGAILAAGGLGDVLTQDGELLVETDSERGAAALDEAFGDTAPQEFVVVQADEPGITDHPALAALATDLAGLDGVAQVVGPHMGVAQLATADDQTALLQVTYVIDGAGDDESRAEALLAALDASPLTTYAVGDATVGHEFGLLAEQNLQTAEVAGLPIALLILIVVFGAVVAALVPMALAIVAIVGAVGATSLVGQMFDLSFFVVNMITMIGLAVGIDYALFVIQRYREERSLGHDSVSAIAIAGDTASRAVVFSGVTVVIALMGLLLIPDTVMRSLGVGAVLVVVAAVLASTSLLPAVLGLLGDRVNAGRLPWVRRRSAGAGPVEHRFWNRVTAIVTARPVVSMSLAAGLLIVLALPYASIELGQNGIDSLPEDSSARTAFEVLNTEFGGGAISTPIAVIGEEVRDPSVTAAVDQLVAALDADDVFGAVTATPAPDGELILVDAALLVDPSSSEAREHIVELRDVTIPTIFDGLDVEALVSGQAAFDLDYREVVSGRTPLVFVVVLGLSFLLLLMAFRSVVVPLKAIVMNLLSVGAAYGMLVAVFQMGIGADLLGFQQVDVIETWIPVFLFAVLFGLSMDYHVFLLSRIKERFDLTGDNTASVAFGLGATGSIITGAAAIMVAVFAGFAAGDLVMFQQMGFGLAAAVILDATIVRSVLVPATMQLLGERNWYFPRWLEWIPQIAIEGHARHESSRALVLEDAPQPELVDA